MIPNLIKVFLLSLFVWHSAMANEPKRITFSCWIGADLPAFSAMEILYRDAFAALGYEFAMVSKPPLRSLAEANSGITDGECARVANYLDSTPDSPLKRVEVMIAKTNLDAWSYDSTIRLNGPASLVGNQYKIAYGKGTVAMQLLLSRLPLENLQPVSSIELGIKMLARKRFDVLISPSAIFKQELARNPTSIELYYVGTILELEGYPYLHERHEKIMETFTEELRKRIPEGGLALPEIQHPAATSSATDIAQIEETYFTKPHQDATPETKPVNIAKPPFKKINFLSCLDYALKVKTSDDMPTLDLLADCFYP